MEEKILFLEEKINDIIVEGMKIKYVPYISASGH